MTKEPLIDYHKQDAKTRRSLRRQARSGSRESGFMHYLAAEIIGERLAVTLRDFRHPVLLFDNPYAEEIIVRLCAEDSTLKDRFRTIRKPPDEILPIEPGTCDLVVAILDLHRINDPAAMLFQINHTLQPDGLFMAALPAQGTLEELRQSLIAGEIEDGGGAGARVDTFAEISRIGDLVQQTGFKLPVVDIEERVIRYSRLQGLISDLRDTGAGNVSPGLIRPVTRSGLAATERIYRENHGDPDGKLRVTARMAMISGWKEDASQQKPLKPGSAKNRLSDFL